MADLQSGGVYFIVNKKSGTTMDVSGGDGRTVLGYTLGGGDNQKFRVEQVSEYRWTLQDLRGKYLAVEAGEEDGTPIVGSDRPFEWYIEQDGRHPGSHRMMVPDTPFVVDLADKGNPEPGTGVQLWHEWGGANQAWDFKTLDFFQG